MIVENLRKISKQLFLFLILTLLIIAIQFVILAPHLQYGFGDVDWGFLSTYREHKQITRNLFENFVKSFHNWGVYTHQEYYIGIQSEFFGLDFKSFQTTTHVLKTLATIFTYPLFLSLTGSMLAAFIGTIFFAASYASVGTMYTVVTSSDYMAVLSMVLFFWFYSFLIKTDKSKLIYFLAALFLLLQTLFLSTERMYPILFWILIVEIFQTYQNKFSKDYFKIAFKRIGILFFPFIVVLISNPKVYSSFIFGNGTILFKKILAGDFFNLLRPFISMGGMVIPNSYWKYFGVVRAENLEEFIKYFLQGPFAIFVFVTSILGFSIFSRPRKFIFQTLFVTLVVGFLTFWLGTNNKTHFDPSFIAPALIGAYITIFGVICLVHYLKYQREKRLVNLAGGLLFAFLYIILTWIASDVSETPTGSHRYLTIPALSVCFSIGVLMAVVIKRLLKLKGPRKILSIIPIIIILYIISIWSQEVLNFFNGQLKQGFGAYDKQLMRGQLLSYLDNLSDTQKSLIFFDFSEDKDNGYYYDNTLLAGLGSWILWHKKINFRHELMPDAIWSDFQQLKYAKSIKDNKEGFNFRGNFYSLENFYAFKLKDRKVVNIRKEVLNKLEMEEIN